jgi:hypothetical protein
MPTALPNSALDIVGDVHGEIDALRSLLGHLGYDEEGRHAQGRTLVFVGDLVDRGPDSPGVVRLVRSLVDAGRAFAILGNHELNLLRGEHKSGNDWFWNQGTHHDQRFMPCVTATALERTEFLEFFDSLPLYFQRDDLRITHAAWHGQSIQALIDGPGKSTAVLFKEYDEQFQSILNGDDRLRNLKAEKAQWRHSFDKEDIKIPMLEAIGMHDELMQMSNPIRVLTSGMERLAKDPFFSSGQWRFAERVRWWDEYDDEIPVIVGHYWRQFTPLDRTSLGKGDSDLFTDVPPTQWLGQKHNVFCVDYSVGGRYAERSSGHVGERTRLAALRWPERDLVFDNGITLPSTGYNGTRR